MSDSSVASLGQSRDSDVQTLLHSGLVGPPITATTGFPEGCPLSVVSILATNILIDQWTRLNAPQVQIWSFVDNLQVIAETP